MAVLTDYIETSVYAFTFNPVKEYLWIFAYEYSQPHFVVKDNGKQYEHVRIFDNLSLITNNNEQTISFCVTLYLCQFRWCKNQAFRGQIIKLSSW